MILMALPEDPVDNTAMPRCTNAASSQPEMKRHPGSLAWRRLALRSSGVPPEGVSGAVPPQFGHIFCAVGTLPKWIAVLLTCVSGRSF